MKQNLKIISLGGLGEVGRNLLVLEYDKDILLIDAGLRFPEETMPGVDFIIPNIEYLKGREKKIKGVVISHGHYDHIGGIPYLFKQLKNPPIFCSNLTKGIICKRQEEFTDQAPLKIETVQDGDKKKIGCFEVEFFHQNHSIPQNLGFFIKTPVGNIVHTSDFKFDKKPVNDKPTNFEKLKSFGKRNVLLLMSDSTGAEELGYSISETEIEKNLEQIFQESKARIFAATFASLLNRVQQIINLSEKYNRKVCIEGYSMKNNVEIARNLGYLKVKKDTIISTKEINKYPDSKITIICTGAQGEDNAVLMRIINKEHKFLKIKRGDSVVFSSSVFPGNERSIQYLKDEFYRNGMRVFHYKMMDIHAGGHAQSEELKEMIKMIKPKFFVPVHGQFSMFSSHAEIAKDSGIEEKNIIIAENGQIMNLNEKEFFVEKNTVPSHYIMVDGLGIGDVGEVVLRDRQMLAKDGMFVVIVAVDREKGRVKGSPDIISRGFVYLKDSKELLAETRKRVINLVNQAAGSGRAVNWTHVKDEIRNKVGSFLHSKTKRRPMVLPVVIEV